MPRYTTTYVDVDSVAAKMRHIAPLIHFSRGTLLFTNVLFFIKLLTAIIAAILLVAVAPQVVPFPIFFIVGLFISYIGTITVLRAVLSCNKRIIIGLLLFCGAMAMLSLFLPKAPESAADPETRSMVSLDLSVVLRSPAIEQIAFILTAIVACTWFFLIARGVLAIVTMRSEQRRIVAALPETGWIDRRMTHPFVYLGSKVSIRKAAGLKCWLLVQASSFAFFLVLANGTNTLSIGTQLLDIVLIIFGLPRGSLALLRSELFIIDMALFLWLMPKIALAALRAARLQMLIPLDRMRMADDRRPILFLRSFRDDQIALEPSRQVISLLTDVEPGADSLDHLITAEGTRYGPVVALGRPTDDVPPYGAARGYFTGADWQDGVRRLVDEASAIVVCLDDSKGVWWEVGLLRNMDALEKALFIIHPRYRDSEQNRWLLVSFRAYWGLHLTALDDVINAPSALPGDGAVLGFMVGGSEARVARSDEFSKAAYLALLRSFFRPRFEPSVPAIRPPTPAAPA